MRFLHSADWHLGRSLKNTSLIEDQAHALRQLLGVAGEEKPDLVIVAGDVYDRPMPSGEAVALLDDTLTSLVKGLGIPVLLIAGNHDSGDRVGYGARIFRDENLYVFGSLSPFPDPVVMRDGHGEVTFFGIPYAGPLAAREALGVAEIADHEAVLAEVTRQCIARLPNGGRSVLVAHAFVTGGQACESERGLTVGGTGEVPADVLHGFNYVALGHLHRSQAMDGNRVHYPGSLLKYSASEAGHIKSVKLVDMDAAGACSVKEIPITPLRDLRRISGKLDDLVQDGLRDPRREDFIFAELTDEGALLNPMQRLQEVYPNAVEAVRPETAISGGGESPGIITIDDHERMSTSDLFARFYEYATDSELPAEHRAAFERIVAGMADEGQDNQ